MWWMLSLLSSGFTLQVLVTLYSKITHHIESTLIPKIIASINNSCQHYVNNNHCDQHILVDENYVEKFHCVEYKSPIICETPVINYTNSIDIETYILSKNRLIQFYVISGLSTISLGIIKLLFLFNCVSELAIGMIICLVIQKIFNLKYARYMCLNEIKKTIPLFCILPIVLLAIKNFYDTYRIGLLVFNLSSIMLFITQTFAIYFIELLRITNVVYSNKLRICISWIGLIVLTLFL